MTGRFESPQPTRRDALRLAAAGATIAGAVALGHAAPAGAQDATPAGASGGTSVAKRTVSIAAALSLIEAAHAAAEGIGAPVTVAVVDEGGLLKAFGRMDGVNSAATVDIAQMKAYSAASFRAPTHELAERNRDNPPRLASLPNVPRFTLLAGGYPIRDGDAVVGGIGVSGGTPEQDMEIAEAALAALAG